MKSPHRKQTIQHHKFHRDSVKEFIAQLPQNEDFKLYDWLKTLKTHQLRRIERDAQNCYACDTSGTFLQTLEPELVDIALTVYMAETCFSVSTDEARSRLSDLLIGLGVAACIERLQRVGWVTITRRLGILIEAPQPYRVTHKGLCEGVWSSELMTLWILGNPLQMH